MFPLISQEFLQRIPKDLPGNRLVLESEFALLIIRPYTISSLDMVVGTSVSFLMPTLAVNMTSLVANISLQFLIFPFVVQSTMLPGQVHSILRNIIGAVCVDSCHGTLHWKADDP